MKKFIRLTGALVLIFGLVFASAPLADAQSAEVDAAEFIDPVTGEFDLEAYLAALAAAERAETTVTRQPLPTTGTSSSDLVALGFGLVLVGGLAIALSRGRPPVTGDDSVATSSDTV